MFVFVEWCSLVPAFVEWFLPVSTFDEWRFHIDVESIFLKAAACSLQFSLSTFLAFSVANFAILEILKFWVYFQKKIEIVSGIALKFWNCVVIPYQNVKISWQIRSTFQNFPIQSLFFLFFCHNSWPQKFWGTPLGGNESYESPRPF